MGVVQTLLEGYIVVGGSVTGQMGMSGVGGGVDFVWDLWNEQFSAFVYPSIERSLDIAVGVSAGVQIGFGTGRFPDVHAAWSGPFIGAQASISIQAWRILQLTGHIEGFSSPDGAMVGAIMGVNAGASVPDAVYKLVKFPLDANVKATAGLWTPNDRLTLSATPANRRRDIVRKGGHSYLDLSDGELEVARHMVSVMGPTPLSVGLGLYATAVSMTKSYLESAGITDRRRALEELRALLSRTYRRISEYKRDVPSGTAERQYRGYTVQRTRRGKYIITETTTVPATGESRSIRRLHSPDGDVLDSYRFGVAIDAAIAPNGFVNGRSYNRHPSAPNTYRAEINQRHEQMMRQ